MTDTGLLIVAILGSGGLGAVLTAWINKRPDPIARENTLIDQLQEMVDTTTQHLADAQRREKLLQEYAWACQRHINKGDPPPPPAWPADLLSG